MTISTPLSKTYANKKNISSRRTQGTYPYLLGQIEQRQEYNRTQITAMTKRGIECGSKKKYRSLKKTEMNSNFTLGAHQLKHKMHYFQ